MGVSGGPRDGRRRQGFGGSGGKGNGPARAVGDSGAGLKARVGRRDGWGSVARRGAAVVGEDREHARKRSGEPDRRGGEARGRSSEAQAWPEVERDPGNGRAEVGGASPVAGPGPIRRGRRLPSDVVDELSLRVEKKLAPRVVERLANAAGAYERDRYQDAQRMLVPLIRIAPDAPAVRELMGLCLYRQGRWGEAIRELEHYRRLTGSLDQHPVLADCHRALGHTAAVRELWDELAGASPSPELVAEGRIVMAASLADHGEVGQAIELLDRSLRRSRVTREHHLRQWYALADLLERSGDLARARELFARVAAQDPGLSDVVDRVASLR